MIPRVVRRLPKTPRLENERFDAFDSTAGDLTVPDARRWNSFRDIHWEAGPSDRLGVKTSFELTKNKASISTTNNDSNLTARIVKFALASETEVSTVKEKADLLAYQWIAAQAKELFQRPASLLDKKIEIEPRHDMICLLYTSPSPRDQRGSRMPSSA